MLSVSSKEPPMPTIDAVLDSLKASEKDSIRRWMDWLRIPSISTDPAHAGDCRKAAEWAAAQLREAGFRAEIRPARGEDGKEGRPIVMAFAEGSPGYTGPHILFYGHYD